MENELKFNLDEMGYQDIESMKLIIDVWYNLDDRDIMYEGTGFNKMSGYVYIALENGVTICSRFGQEIEYTDGKGGKYQKHKWKADAEVVKII